MEPIICLITGPAGVGKSTITKNLASQFKNSARIGVFTFDLGDFV